MGRNKAIILAAVFFLGCMGVSFAQDADTTQVPVPEAKVPAVKVPAAPVQVVPEAQALDAAGLALEGAKDTLASKEWNVYLSQPDGKRPRNNTDVLMFKEGKVSSKNLLAEGYPESNFTLTLTGEGVAVWETMQVNEKVGLAFLRGELANGVMKGAMSMQPQKGTKNTLYFSTEQPSYGGAASSVPPVKAKKGKK